MADKGEGSESASGGAGKEGVWVVAGLRAGRFSRSLCAFFAHATRTSAVRCSACWHSEQPPCLRSHMYARRIACACHEPASCNPCVTPCPHEVVCCARVVAAPCAGLLPHPRGKHQTHGQPPQMSPSLSRRPWHATWRRQLRPSQIPWWVACLGARTFLCMCIVRCMLALGQQWRAADESSALTLLLVGGADGNQQDGQEAGA